MLPHMQTKGTLLQSTKQGHYVRLRQKRELQGWPRIYIAEQIGVDLGTVGRWERGECLPHPHYRQRLCILFGKSAYDLGLLSEAVDECDGSEAVLDPHSQVSSTDEQDTIHTLVVKQPAFTPQPIDIPPLEAFYAASDSSAGEGFTLMSQRNRQQMLRKMYSFWINGALEQSLHGADFVALNLMKRYDAVIDPWISAMQQPETVPCPLTAGISIDQIYDEVNGELLILGEPGSGKTTLLLELTRILLERANREEIQPIPVIFNLASWAIKHQPFGDWLVEELCIKYQVPRKLAQVWIQTEQILPLLDGLDELAAAQGACIKAINAYRREHGLLSMVVCCRQADYFAQEVRLLLHCGVVVQPLTAQQIDAYLTSGGEHLSALRHSLQVDPTLQELASRPLMLSILALTYQDKAIDMHSEPLSLDVRRCEVFATYVKQMLTQRKNRSRYTTKQTLHWLTWLARQLVQQQQTEFYIERMQPDWLSNPRASRWYLCLFVGLLMGLTGFTLGPVWWLVLAHIVDGLLWCIPLGLIVTVVLVLLKGGYACLQHMTLRVILYCQGDIPWNYARFLDEASDRLLLHKTGGGYTFIHRLLLDYFASM